MFSSFRAAVRTAVVSILFLSAGLARAEEGVSYPISIKHAFGTTVIEKKPVRVSTLR